MCITTNNIQNNNNLLLLCTCIHCYKLNDGNKLWPWHFNTVINISRFYKYYFIVEKKQCYIDGDVADV